ncbi:MAG: photosystem reaction center subunit H [Candidatus Nephthysia bennettiae]|uniref:PRC and DUF2382 domain-containing protein n=1 Tax=Candidatus Nephthysia bennettiae TaxID=3127016 RepID=A0A934N9R3_9BACT|nr:PRC and DUF2382 domain-containing protein [Candidatus Dormibacteraeota bacterium]MBJ7611881.1 PRC and DUF2382 domain-containing protein [Candidatus Dormibacteraeota bacterium]PZR88987.1 MAG: photosystem reaction center subunit H [Candidatus Dormibacteraeota bacterium]
MNIEDPQSLVGKNVVGSDGEKIGQVEELYFDTDSQQPEWISVTTGWFGTHRSLVPLADASEDDGGLRIPYAKAQVQEAPHYDPGTELSVEEEADLYRHYGVTGGERGSESSASGTSDIQGRDVSGPTTDEAMTRSEERMRVGTERVETGRARLRKYIVTENVQTTVPVSREEVRVEREPITDANRGQAMSGPELSEEEHEVVLTEERPVVGKETVPVERVRLGKETTTEERQVSDQVRKEQVEIDDQTGSERP